MRGHGHAGEVGIGGAGLFFGADADVILVVAGVKGGRDLTGYQRVQGLFDIEHGDAEIGGAGPVDDQAHFRFAGAQGGIGVGNEGNAFHLCQQGVGVFAELIEVRPLNEELNFGVALVAADGGDEFDAGVNGFRIFLQQFARLLHDLHLTGGA